MSPGWLLFHGASYRAVVSVDGLERMDHRGIWDAFTVPLEPGVHEIEVEVTKNGGPTFPVGDVLSGFLPYVYGTFGGLFREVELCDSAPDLEPTAPPCRVRVSGSKLALDGKAWELRGVLSWGWYPEVGAPHPPADEFLRELRAMKELGFNTFKACLWLPPHYALELVEQEGMLAWLELPLWMPSLDDASLEAALDEVARIVRQYRRHRCIVAWTFGCELSGNVPHGFRRRLVELGSELTGAALVKDSSGGSEMYARDLREYGTFEDFHPYCDAQWYPAVMETLRTGPRAVRPVLLGEFDDYDCLRPLSEVRDAYWASSDPAKNDQGVRWQHDLPGVVERGTAVADEASLAKLSESKGRWARLHGVRSAIAHQEVGGYVVTGITDTPISTSGVLEQGRFEPGDFSGDQAFLIVPRRPPWERGGNRPGWTWPYVQPEGEAVLRVAVRSERGHRGTIRIRSLGRTLYEGTSDIEPVVPCEVAQVALFGEHGQTVGVDVEWGDTTRRITVQFWRSWQGGASFTPAAAARLGLDAGGEGPLVALASEEHPETAVVLADDGPGRPFFRECVHRGAGAVLPEDAWDSWLCIAASHVLEPRHSAGIGAKAIVTRLDTRTYVDEPVVARVPGRVYAALRVGGGEGVQPLGLRANPAGAEALRRLLDLAAGE